MTDINKKKADAKKGIRALLMSAKLGLTFTELKEDYFAFFGTPLPGKEFGYNSVEDFIKDIPDVAKTSFDGRNMVLKAVADDTTRHIENMVSKQKVDTKKKLALISKRSAVRSRSRWEPPCPQRRPPPPHRGPPSLLGAQPFQRIPPLLQNGPPFQQRGPQPSQNRNYNWGKWGQSDRYDHHSHGHQYHTYNRNVAPRLRQAQHRTVVSVPSHIQTQIHDLVCQHQEGLPLTHFTRIFRARYGVSLDSQQMGFQDDYEMLASIPIIVSLKRFQQGEMRVLPVDIRRDTRTQHTEEKPHSFRDSKNTSSPNEVAVQSTPVGKEEDDWDNLFDTTSCNISEAVQRNIEKLLSENQEGMKASSLLFEYKKMFMTELPMKTYGYNSAIEFVSHLSHVVRIERPNKFDWILYPKTSSRTTSAVKQNLTSNASSEKEASSSSRAPKSVKSSLSVMSSHKVEWEVKEAISQVLSLNPKGIPVDRFLDTYKEMTGKNLQVEKYGVNNVKTFLHSLDDILYIMLDMSDNPVVCSLHEGPRRFDLLTDKYKPITPSPKSQTSSSHSQHRIPPQAVTPGCYYKPQSVIYLEGTGCQNYIELYVAFTSNPGHFWIQLRGQKTTLALEDLMDALEESYGDPTKLNSVQANDKDYHIPPELAKPGLVCAVIYPEDQFWHRGIITGDVKDNLYEVFYVDYGNTCYVSLQNMRFLKAKFLSLSAQAIRGRLSNVQPLMQNWSVRARQRFLDLTKERPLLGFVTAFKDRILSLCLTDTSGKDDIHINDLLTHEGYAEFKPDQEDSVSPEDNMTCSLTLTNDFLYGGVKGTGPIHESLEQSHQGQDGDRSETTTWRRYVRQAQMSDDLIFNLINLGSGDLYVMSSEISALFFDEDIISSKLRKDKTDIPKVVVTKENYADLYAELLSYEVSAITESTKLLSLFPLKALPLMMEMYGKHKELDEVKDIILEVLEWFDSEDPYWKGEDDQSTESGETTEETATDSQSVASESKDSFRMDDLQMVLKMLQMKRSRSLKKLLEGGEGVNQVDEVNALNQVEMDTRRVESLIRTLEKRQSSDSDKQTQPKSNPNVLQTAPTNPATTAIAGEKLKSQTEIPIGRGRGSLYVTPQSQPPQASSLQSQPPQASSLQSQMLQRQPLSQFNHPVAISQSPVTATVAPTLKPLCTSVNSSSLSMPSSLSNLGGVLGGSGLGDMSVGSTRVAATGGTMDVAEMLRQQMAINSWLMSQMNVMNTTSMLPSGEQMLQQQMLQQQQQLQLLQQQQQQLQRQKQQLPTMTSSSILSSLPPSSSSSLLLPNMQGAPGFPNPTPMMGMGGLNAKPTNAGFPHYPNLVLNSSTVTPNTMNVMNSNVNANSMTSNNTPANSNVFCANLGRVLSSALNDKSNFPSSNQN